MGWSVSGTDWWWSSQPRCSEPSVVSTPQWCHLCAGAAHTVRVSEWDSADHRGHRGHSQGVGLDQPVLHAQLQDLWHPHLHPQPAHYLQVGYPQHLGWVSPNLNLTVTCCTGGNNDEVLDLVVGVKQSPGHIAVAYNSPATRLYSGNTWNCVLATGY